MISNKSIKLKLAKYLSVLTLVLLLFIIANSMYAQEPLSKESKDDEVFIVVDKLPEFPGGAKAIMKFIIDNFVYPVELEDDCILGRIITRFIVNKDGSLTDIHIVRSPDPRLDEEAIRVISMMPKWEPGELKGEPVRVKFIIPIAIETLKRNTGDNKNLEKEENQDDEVFTIVDKHPEFPGGERGLMNWLSTNLQFPPNARDARIEGRVIVNFIIEKDGAVSTVKLVRSLDPMLDKEVMRVVSLMPKWKPGELKGKTVRVLYTLPIEFRLTDEEKSDNESSEKTIVGLASSDKEGDNEVFVFGNRSKKEGTPQTLAEKFKDANPIIFIDGERKEKGYDFNKIKPEDIESISIEEKDVAMGKYGPIGKDGVVMITTKSSKGRLSIFKILDANIDRSEDDVYMVTEVQPQFPGGMPAFMKYLTDNIQYPSEAKKNKTEGRVLANFIVNIDGSISDVKIVDSLSPLMDAEAIRLLSSMPKWEPGRQRGKRVKVRYTFPVIFRLQNGDTSTVNSPIESD